MIVVSDTSSINYLVIIGYIEVLLPLFGTVIIPEQVLKELMADDTPQVVRDWIDAKPDWLEVHDAKPILIVPRLHSGESAAIGLALEIQPDTVLIDERFARSFARLQGLEVTGVLGVLERAHQQGLLDLETALNKLKATSFRISERLLEDVLKRNA